LWVGVSSPKSPCDYAIRPGGEQQRVRRADHSVAELQRPQPVDCEPLAVLAPQGAEGLRAHRVVGVDAPVAEVADQNDEVAFVVGPGPA
jgi:hypothetical protein